MIMIAMHIFQKLNDTLDWATLFSNMSQSTSELLLV